MERNRLFVWLWLAGVCLWWGWELLREEKREPRPEREEPQPPAGDDGPEVCKHCGHGFDATSEVRVVVTRRGTAFYHGHCSRQMQVGAAMAALVEADARGRVN